MRRAILEKAGRFRLEEAPRPAPGPGEVLLRVRQVGICGSDLHLFKDGMIGDVPIELGGQASPSWLRPGTAAESPSLAAEGDGPGVAPTGAKPGGPFVPGHECVAVVEEAGPGAPRELVGRRVAVEPGAACGRCETCLAGHGNLCPHMRFLGHPPIAGCLQEFVVHRADLVAELPDGIDDDAGVMLEPLGVALHSLRIGKVRPARTAAVLGSGPVGLCCTLLLSRMGHAPLLATDLLDGRADAARSLGATHALNPNRDDVAAMAREMTGGRGFDYVLECAGTREAIMQAPEIAAVGGRVLVLGIPGADDDRLCFRHSAARRRGLTIHMIRRSNLPARDCIRWTLRDRLPLSGVVTNSFPLERVQEAFESAAACAGGALKTVVTC